MIAGSRPSCRLVAIASLIACGLAGPAPALADCLEVLKPGPTRAVVRIIDAETVALDDGSEVRLVGALPPRPDEPAADAQWPPLEAAENSLQKLLAGQTVEVRSQGRKLDRYGHILAHLFVVAGDGGTTRQWVQGTLVGEGHARAYGFGDSRACLRELLELEDGARAASLGLWSHAAYKVRGAAEPRELLRYRHSYQLVEGRVLEVAETKARFFLNFGADHREDFTIAILRKDTRGFSASGIDLTALEGKTIRVRGWIESWNGPLIQVTHAEQLELIAEGD